MINSAGIMPRPGYLEAVREACTRTGTVLIFDEVITGFRVAPGGAQEAFGVLPDLTTLGKALANGFPVAALAGSRDLMSLFTNRSVVHGGTYNAQGPGMAATAAALEAIRRGDAVARVQRAGERLREGLTRVLHDAGVPARSAGFPGAFNVAFDDGDPWDFRSALRTDRARYVAMTTALLEHGVRALPRGTWFVSSAHDDHLVDETVHAVAGVLEAQRVAAS
jgi:glutamate-1-semialdehyde 2,1-aminomutase